MAVPPILRPPPRSSAPHEDQRLRECGLGNGGGLPNGLPGRQRPDAAVRRPDPQHHRRAVVLSVGGAQAPQHAGARAPQASWSGEIFLWTAGSTWPSSATPRRARRRCMGRAPPVLRNSADASGIASPRPGPPCSGGRCGLVELAARRRLLRPDRRDSPGGGAAALCAVAHGARGVTGWRRLPATPSA